MYVSILLERERVKENNNSDINLLSLMQIESFISCHLSSRDHISHPVELGMPVEHFLDKTNVNIRKFLNQSVGSA